MTFLNPAAFVWAALAFPILAFYMLRLRRREIPVSSIYLWEALLKDRLANTPWQRIRRNLLLLIQLGILLALILGLARPALNLPVVSSGSVVLLLDASASMQATDVPPDRFALAVQEAHRLVDRLPEGSEMTIIRVGPNPQMLTAFETDKTALSATLDAAQPGYGEANWPAAFAIAAGMVRNAQTDTTTVILSDGGMESQLAPYPGDVLYLPIGKTGENLGFSAMALRSNPEETQLFTQVMNYGTDEKSVLLSIYRNDDLISAKRLTIAGGGNTSDLLTGLPDQEAIYTAHISSPESAADSLDPLESDNWGYAIQRATSGGRVLLVSEGNFFLEELLLAFPGITAFRSSPDDLPALTAAVYAQYDLVIFDRVYAETGGSPNVLLLAPPDNSIFSVSGTFDPATEPIRITDNPMMKYVDWENIHIGSASAIEAPDWAEVLVGSGEHPLVFAGQDGTQRIAALTFNLIESDLALQTTFPILFANLLSYLLPGPQSNFPQTLAPGENLSRLPLQNLEAPQVLAPSGTTIWPTPDKGPFASPQVEVPGVYQVTYLSSGSPETLAVAVNQFSPLEGNIQPALSLNIGREVIEPHPSSEKGEWEISRSFTAAAILLLLLEWWVYHRGRADRRLQIAFNRSQ